MKAPSDKSMQATCGLQLCRCFYSFTCCCLPNLRNSTKIRIYSSSLSSKITDLGVSRKRICDFLLVINSRPNYGRISYRFRDIDAFTSIINFFHRPLAWRPLAEERLAIGLST